MTNLVELDTPTHTRFQAAVADVLDSKLARAVTNIVLTNPAETVLQTELLVHQAQRRIHDLTAITFLNAPTFPELWLTRRRIEDDLTKVATVISGTMNAKEDYWVSKYRDLRHERMQVSKKIQRMPKRDSTVI